MRRWRPSVAAESHPRPQRRGRHLLPPPTDPTRRLSPMYAQDSLPSVHRLPLLPPWHRGGRRWGCGAHRRHCHGPRMQLLLRLIPKLAAARRRAPWRQRHRRRALHGVDRRADADGHIATRARAQMRRQIHSQTHAQTNTYTHPHTQTHTGTGTGKNINTQKHTTYYFTALKPI